MRIQAEVERTYSRDLFTRYRIAITSTDDGPQPFGLDAPRYTHYDYALTRRGAVRLARRELRRAQKKATAARTVLIVTEEQ